MLCCTHLHSVRSNVNALEQSVGELVARLLDLDLGKTVFSVGMGVNLSAEGDGNFLWNFSLESVSTKLNRAHLETVTDTQDRYAVREDFRVNLGCILIVDGVRGSGQDDT